MPPVSQGVIWAGNKGLSVLGGGREGKSWGAESLEGGRLGCQREAGLAPPPRRSPSLGVSHPERLLALASCTRSLPQPHRMLMLLVTVL